MTNTPNAPYSHWSDSLRQQTRQAIEALPLTADGCLHFKHATLGFAHASFDDLMQDRLVLQRKTGDAAYLFDEVESLLQAGWALD